MMTLMTDWHDYKCMRYDSRLHEEYCLVGNHNVIQKIISNPLEELLPSLEGQMKAEGSFQILTMSWEILFQIPEDSNLLGYHCRNLKSHFNFMSSGLNSL
jgi:hypothetical protein